jgi:hypothetical protein
MPANENTEQKIFEETKMVAELSRLAAKAGRRSSEKT